MEIIFLVFFLISAIVSIQKNKRIMSFVAGIFIAAFFITLATGEFFLLWQIPEWILLFFCGLVGMGLFNLINPLFDQIKHSSKE